MKRILPFLLAVPVAAYAFACSSSSGSSTNNSNPDGGPGTTNPDGGPVDSTGDAATGPESNTNPTTGVTVATFSNTAAAVHGLTWVPADKVFYAALPTSSDPFDGTAVRTVGKVVRIKADGSGDGILAGTAATGPIFSAALNAKTNKVLVIGTNQILAIAPTGTSAQTGTVFSSTYAGNLGNEDAGAGAAPFAGLNDIVFKKDGSGAYVTEPYYPGGAPPTAFHRVYYVKTDGTAQAVAHYENNEGPNGVALSPDEKTLYVALTTPTVADPGRNLPVYGEYPAIWKYTVNTDGSLTAGAKFAQVGTTKTAPEQLTKPDGLVVDKSGNVYVATVQGVVVYKPSGDVWGTIPTPEQVASLAWGGDDLKTLYMGSSNDPCIADPAAVPPVVCDASTAKNTGTVYKAAMQVTGIAR